MSSRRSRKIESDTAEEFSDATEPNTAVAEADFEFGANGPQPVGPAIDQALSNATAQAEQPRKKWTPPPNPLNTEGKYGRDKKGLHLLKSEPESPDEQGAWVIRFDVPPNEIEGYSKENPHPVIKMLKESGFRWGFDQRDGKGGWGKTWGDDPWGEDHTHARKVMQKAAEMVGVSIDQGRILD